MCKTSDLVDQLSADERISLKKIARGSDPDKLPMAQVTTLIKLGLAFVEMGKLSLTGTGRRAVSMI